MVYACVELTRCGTLFTLLRGELAPCDQTLYDERRGEAPARISIMGAGTSPVGRVAGLPALHDQMAGQPGPPRDSMSCRMTIASSASRAAAIRACIPCLRRSRRSGASGALAT